MVWWDWSTNRWSTSKNNRAQPGIASLETIRQYAMEKLLESGEAVESRNRHLDYMLKLTGTAEPGVFRLKRLAWLDQMEVEHDNLRAALEWSSSNDLAKAIELALALGSFWTSRDYNSEAVAWCQTILARAESLPDLAATRAELYVVLAQSAIFCGQPQARRRRRGCRLEPGHTGR